MWLMMPKAGKIMMYTSGWPKNQKMCWYITGSPPAAGLKKLVPKWRSVSVMVMAPANTGITAISMVAYMKNSWPVTGMPVVNMWCAQTMNDRMAIEDVAYTIEA